MLGISIPLALGLTLAGSADRLGADILSLEVTVPDVSLRAMLKDLGLSDGAPTPSAELAKLTVLEALDSGIVYLTGLPSAQELPLTFSPMCTPMGQSQGRPHGDGAGIGTLLLKTTFSSEPVGHMHITHGGTEGSKPDTSAATATQGKELTHAKRIALKFVAGSISGAAGGFLGGSLLSSGCNGQGVCGGIGFLVGGSIGTGFGTAAGLSLVDSESQFGLALISSWLGVVLGIGLIGDSYERAWPAVLVCSSGMATFVSETSKAGRLPSIFMSHRPPTPPRFLLGLAPDSRGRCSLFAVLRF